MLRLKPGTLRRIGVDGSFFGWSCCDGGAEAPLRVRVWAELEGALRALELRLCFRLCAPDASSGASFRRGVSVARSAIPSRPGS